jgi:transcriptional regulator with XRE-family HTH domain
MPRVSGKVDRAGSLAVIGSAIRATRMTLGLSQEALAHAAGIDRSHMGKIERGERNLTLLNLLRIAAALQVKSSVLLEQANL